MRRSAAWSATAGCSWRRSIPHSAAVHLFRGGGFEPYEPQADDLPVGPSSLAWYRGWRDHLEFAAIDPGDGHPTRTAREPADERRRSSSTALGVCVVASPALLLAVLGLTSLLARPLSEEAMARWTAVLRRLRPRLGRSRSSPRC